MLHPPRGSSTFRLDRKWNGRAWLEHHVPRHVELDDRIRHGLVVAEVNLTPFPVHSSAVQPPTQATEEAALCIVHRT